MKKNKADKEDKDCGGTIAIINGVAREGVTYKLARRHLSRDSKEVREWGCGYMGKKVPGREYDQYKGPMEGVCLVCSRELASRHTTEAEWARRGSQTSNEELDDVRPCGPSSEFWLLVLASWGTVQGFEEKGTSSDLCFKRFTLVAVLRKSRKLLITSLFLSLGLRVSTSSSLLSW